MKRYVALLCFFLLHQSISAQNYYSKHYLVENGLPSDIVKGCAQDSLGYFWIATDEGLVKYDGIKFTSYREKMHSNYAKGFFTTRKGRLLAYSDLDLIEINNQGDTVIFKSLYPVLRVANDSSISYPKLLFEDAHGDIWVSEAQSVVRLRNRSIKRYDFDILNRTPQFLRSFSFFEDQKKDLFISSYQGNVFRYNSHADKFELVKERFTYGVEFVSTQGNQLLVGSADGLSVGTLLASGGFETPKSKLKTSAVSYVAPIPGGKQLIATRGNTHHLINSVDQNIHNLPHAINNINHVYVSRENDILISGNEGLIMMRENFFQAVQLQETNFIESITQDRATGIIYFATSQKLYSFDYAAKKVTELLNIPTGYFQSLLFTKEGLWIANAFKVFLFANGKIKHQFDFSARGRFVTTLTSDKAGNIWLSIPGSTAALMIDSQKKLVSFNVPLQNEGVINSIHQAKDGMYIASGGSQTYLYFKSYNDSVFKNISMPLPISTHGDFSIADFVELEKKIWLATTDGLLKWENGHIQRVYLGEKFTKLPIKSIRLYKKNKLLLANAFGLILLDLTTGTFDLFNEGSGLSSNTITTRGLFVGNDDRIWIGTAKGLSYSNESMVISNKTPTPRTQVLANGKKVNAKSEITFGSFLSFQVSSITFPNEVTFEYKLSSTPEWNVTTNFELNFSSLPAGKHVLEVRAKKNGPYSWSDSSYYSFIIAKPIWQRWWFYLLFIFGLAILVVITIFWVNATNKMRNTKLQALIDERTRALQISNNELIHLNLEKNNLIEIVAHDLKSPVSQVKGLLSLLQKANVFEGEASEYLMLMDKSISRLNEMILKILDIDAIDSRQLNLKMERHELSNILNTVADRYEKDAKKKEIVLIRQIESGIFIWADNQYCEQVFENLISNAIKFSPFNLKVFLSVTIKGNRAVCQIRDQGLGLSKHEIKKLFGKYQKLTPRPTGNELSTGLGLSIAKKFTSAMNAEIWCESELGKGTSFFVSFESK